MVSTDGRRLGRAALVVALLLVTLTYAVTRVFVRGFEPTDATVFGGPDESDHRDVSARLNRE